MAASSHLGRFRHRKRAQSGSGINVNQHAGHTLRRHSLRLHVNLTTLCGTPLPSGTEERCRDIAQAQTTRHVTGAPDAVRRRGASMHMSTASLSSTCASAMQKSRKRDLYNCQDSSYADFKTSRLVTNPLPCAKWRAAGQNLVVQQKGLEGCSHHVWSVNSRVRGVLRYVHDDRSSICSWAFQRLKQQFQTGRPGAVADFSCGVWARLI